MAEHESEWICGLRMKNCRIQRNRQPAFRGRLSYVYESDSVNRKRYGQKRETEQNEKRI